MLWSRRSHASRCVSSTPAATRAAAGQASMTSRDRTGDNRPGWGCWVMTWYAANGSVNLPNLVFHGRGSSKHAAASTVSACFRDPSVEAENYRRLRSESSPHSDAGDLMEAPAPASLGQVVKPVSRL